MSYYITKSFPPDDLMLDSIMADLNTGNLAHPF